MQETQTSETSHTAIETEDFAALLHAQNEKLVSEMTLEEKRAKVAAFNIMDDAFFHKMMEDKEVCEESLRIILQEPNLKVLSCQPQSSLKNLNGKSAILDVKCSFSDGSAIAELMKYYGNTKPENESCHFPKIVDRVNQYKQNEKEVTDMCEIMERERKKELKLEKNRALKSAYSAQLRFC